MTVTRIGYRPAIAKRLSFTAWCLSAIAVLCLVRSDPWAISITVAVAAVLAALGAIRAARRPVIEIDGTTVRAIRGFRRFSMPRSAVTGVRLSGSRLLIEGAGGPISVFASDVDATAEDIQRMIGAAPGT